MSERYKIRIIKKYDFELDGISDKDIKEQVDYILTHTKILDLPEIRKNIKIKIKKNHERKISNEENC